LQARRRADGLEFGRWGRSLASWVGTAQATSPQRPQSLRRTSPTRFGCGGVPLYEHRSEEFFPDRVLDRCRRRREAKPVVVAADRRVTGQLLEIPSVLKESHERTVACRAVRFHSTKSRIRHSLAPRSRSICRSQTKWSAKMIDADPRVAFGVGRSVVTAWATV
jgi:hypothetical protein